jgi:hypothetical protein
MRGRPSIWVPSSRLRASVDGRTRWGRVALATSVAALAFSPRTVWAEETDPAGDTAAESAEAAPAQPVEAAPETKPAEAPRPPEAAPTPPPAPATTPASTQPPKLEPPKPKPEPKDEMPEAGYIPGYRRHTAVGLSPFVPQMGALPGGTTPGFAAPSPSVDWSFKWSGYMSISLQTTARQRHDPLWPGQSRMVFHAPPATIDEWYAFVSTNTVPGNWVGMTFQYGNRYVTANVFMSTWNLSDPSTYYQIGPQQYVQNAYLAFTPEPIADFQVRATVGFFTTNYGNLGKYGPGMYVNPIIGYMRGAGETLSVEHDLGDTVVLSLEHGIMGPKTGTLPLAATGVQPLDNTLNPASWVHHAHVGFTKKGDPGLAATLHYVSNWSADDTRQFAYDNTKTQAVDEARLKDGRLDVYGFDAHLNTDVWGNLGIGGAYVHGKNAYTLKGFSTWAGDGEQLTDRWWGPQSHGTGELFIAGLNYAVSLGKIVSYPVPFAGDGPDIVVNAAFNVAVASTSYQPLDGRVRYKYGIDGLYTLLKWFGAGLRFDQVVPNGGESRETFFVLAPRLQFKTDWNSRETFSLRYAKWFYGSRTHSDLLGARRIDRLDDQLFALNFNMGW